MSSPPESHSPPARTTCVIVGGGPAGLVLGLLLARAKVDVVVLEKHKDFLRDFRGDTVHPSTMDLLEDLGLFSRFSELPQSRIERVSVPGPDGVEVPVADFTRLRVRHPYIALVPQWDLLDLLAGAAAAEPSFTLHTEHAVTGVVRDGGRVTGVTYRTPRGEGQVLADLTVACDGRGSVVRDAAGLHPRTFAVGFDVWWYRIPSSHRAQESLLPRLGAGRAAVLIPREGYFQVAALGRKGTDADVRAAGINAFRAAAADFLPEFAADVGGIPSMDAVKHLDVRVDRLRRWHAPGVLCIGDAAHAMSPVGGVGINLAVQDAVAAARHLAAALRDGMTGGRRERRILARVHRRRVAPTVVLQTLQRVIHSRVIMPALDGSAARPQLLVLGLFRRFPVLTAFPAALIGVGPRPEPAPEWARRGSGGQACGTEK